jgi:hypothetical protein
MESQGKEVFGRSIKIPEGEGIADKEWELGRLAQNHVRALYVRYSSPNLPASTFSSFLAR